MQERPAMAIDDNLVSELELRERAATVLQRLDQEMNTLLPRASERKVVDQMMMRGGIFEWVIDEKERPPWVGMGKPHTSFVPGFFNLRTGNPTFRPRNPETDRLFQIGFRLLKKV
jgi:hypothetical protein